MFLDYMVNTGKRNKLLYSLKKTLKKLECYNVLILTCPSANQRFRQSWFFVSATRLKPLNRISRNSVFRKQRVDVHTTKRFRF